MTGVGINVLPYTFLLDADGALVYTQVGPVSSVDQLVQLKAMNVTPEFVQRIEAIDSARPSVDKLVQLKAFDRRH